MKICKFVEGSFIPSCDGASQKFAHITQSLSKISDLTVVHCYRGWSDLKKIKHQSFKTFAISPDHYYRNYQIVDRIIKSVMPDVVEMNDPELLVSTGLHINKKFKIPIVYDAHFVSSILVKDITKNHSAAIPETKFERKVGKIVSGTVCLTNEDKQNLLISTNQEKDRIQVIPLGSNVNEIKYRTVTNNDRAILFLGNMFFQPNQEAVDTIVNRIAPLVFNKIDNVIFKFVGDVPANLVRKYENNNIIFQGRIKNINRAFNGVRVCIAPVTIGGGMRVKILSYMASGIPIVSTKIAATGIKYEKFINIAETPKEFAEAVLELFNNLPKSIKQGKIAFEEALESHSWDKIASKTLNFYKKTIKKPVISTLNPTKIKRDPFWLTETIEKGRFKNNPIDKKNICILGNNKMQLLEEGRFIQNQLLI